MRQKMKTVLGMYATRDGVQFAVEAFRDAGFKNSDISVVLPEHMPVEEIGGQHRKDRVTSRGSVGLTAFSALNPVVPGAQEEGILMLGPMSQAANGTAQECTPEGLEDALMMLGISECDTGGYADKVLQGRALLSVHCENADLAAAARRLHCDLGGMDLFTARQAGPYRSMAFSSGR